MPERHRSGDACLRVLGNMTSLRRLEAGQLETSESRVRLADIVSQAAVVVRPQLADGVEWRQVLHDSARRTFAADGNMLLQILTNVAQNATRHTSVGFIEISVREIEPPAAEIGREIDDRPGVVWVELRVRDSGSGMSAESGRTCFSKCMTSCGGGLGLYLTSLQVQHLRGQVLPPVSPWSNEHSGTEFTLLLPLRPTDAGSLSGEEAPPLHEAVSPAGAVSTGAVSPDGAVPPAGAVPLPPDAGATAAAAAVPAAPPPAPLSFPPGVRVLVADDVRINRTLLRRAFVSGFGEGWSVTEAATAEEALAALPVGHGFDLLVTDEHFGHGMRGSDVVRALREREAATGERRLAVVCCSGNASNESPALRSCGVDELWDKPFPNPHDGTMQRRVAGLLSLPAQPPVTAAGASGA